MIIELGNGYYTNQKDGNILFHGSSISNTYKNLLIIFTNRNTKSTLAPFSKGNDAGYAFGSYKGYKVIIINNLQDNKNPHIGIRKDGFIHEFIHYLDYQRSGYTNKISKELTENDYYNSPREFNAYYQEGASYIVKILKDDDILPRFQEKYTNFPLFLKWMLENVFDKEFIKALTDKYMIKLNKRVYNIYTQYLMKKI